jgi:uncharacterized protein YcaQ
MTTQTPIELTATDVRRLAVTRQHLSGQRATATPDGIYDVIRDLGCVQIDPIRAVERTQYLVLWSRVGAFDYDDFHQLLYQDWRLFEYWAHAASFVLVEDYPLHAAHMRNWGQGNRAWTKRARKWMQENDDFRRYVLDEIGRNGPLASNQLEDRSTYAWPSSGWNGNRNVGMMIDFLWTRGELVVAERDRLHRKWGKSEQYLPDAITTEPWSDKQVTHVAAQKSLRALGVATEKQIKQHFIRGRYKGLPQTLKQLTKEGVIVPVVVKDDSAEWPGDWYIHSDDLPLLDGLRNGSWQPRTTLLSPFDNLICDRDRTELMWDYYFRIEIYVPKAKRQFGYYVLPILHGDDLIGRIDPKMDRKTNTLHIHNVYAEENAPDDTETVAAIGNNIVELARFLGANEIALGNVPAEWEALRKIVA